MPRLLLYHGINLACIVTVDAESSAPHVGVQYAVRQVDACFTFQSIAHDYERCSYILNYVVPEEDLIDAIRYQSRINISYFTNFKPSRLNDTSYCEDKKYGVHVVKREPSLNIYHLGEESEDRVEDARYQFV